MHKVIYEITNSNNHSSHGAIIIDRRKYFFKRLDEIARTREVRGHDAVRAYYPVAQMYGTYHDGKDELLLFEFIHNARIEGGMLSDILDTTYLGGIDAAPIIDMYKNAYMATYTPKVCTAHSVFFADRVHTRVKDFYSAEFIDAWTNRTVVINGRVVTIRLAAMLQDIKDFFMCEGEQPSVIAQGDPTEYNISTAPILLDYDAGGYIPIMAEAAVMVSTTAYFGDYMARKYNPGYYQRRGLTQINAPAGDSQDIQRVIPLVRRQFLLDFASMIDAVVGAHLPLAMAHSYVMYFAMKILGVFDISAFDESETAYLLGVLQNLFDNYMECGSVMELTGVSLL